MKDAMVIDNPGAEDVGGYYEDVFCGYGVEVTLPYSDAFLKVKETLTRIGSQTKPNHLDQLCFILHKRGRYAIMHYAELLALDGSEPPGIDWKECSAVRNTVADLLQQWELVTIAYPEEAASPRWPIGKLKIVPYKAKSEWTFNPLYQIGRRR